MAWDRSQGRIQFAVADSAKIFPRMRQESCPAIWLWLPPREGRLTSGAVGQETGTVIDRCSIGTEDLYRIPRGLCSCSLSLDNKKARECASRRSNLPALSLFVKDICVSVLKLILNCSNPWFRRDKWTIQVSFVGCVGGFYFLLFLLLMPIQSKGKRFRNVGFAGLLGGHRDACRCCRSLKTSGSCSTNPARRSTVKGRRLR